MDYVLSSSLSKAVVAVATALALSACAFDSSGPSAAVDAGARYEGTSPEQDRGADAAADTGEDTGVDIAFDLSADAGVDLAVDTAAADLAADSVTVADAAADLPADTSVDLTVAVDTGPDGPVDAATPDSPPQPPPNTIYAFFAPTITIDGDLSDWSAAGWLSISAPPDWLSEGGSPSGASDISASFAARWDSTALYLAFKVTDDLHRNVYAANPPELWRGDSVQVGLDVANNGGSAYDTTDDFEYGWAVATNGTTQITHRWYAPSGSLPAANTFVVGRSGTTTTYEVKLPLSDLGVSTLSSGQLVGFSLILNEDDGSDREGFLEWTTGMGWSKNPGQFGDLKLLP